jgi:hypothetical protein
MKPTLALFLVVFVASAFSLTTLQEALTSAFVENLQSGVWNSIFGIHGLTASDTCSPPSTDYPYPLESPDTDLYSVLQNGEFVCAYPRDVNIYAPDGAVVLATPFNQPAVGLMVTFYEALMDSLSSHYQKEISIKWSTNFVNYSDSLNAVLVGNASSACGFYNPGGHFTTLAGVVEPRSSALSVFNCFSFLQQPLLYSLQTPSDFPITSWLVLVSKINQKGTNFVVCTSGYMQYGDITDFCTSTVNQFAVVANYTCVPAGDYAFNYLQSGACDVVWGGPPTLPPANPANTYVSFTAPTYIAGGSFFRFEDL